MNNLEQDLTERLSFIFDKFKALPSYEGAQKRITFAAQPRKNDTLDKLKSVIEAIKSDVVITSNFGCHSFEIDDVHVTIIYLSEHEDFDFFYQVSSYGINSILGKIIKRANLKLSQDGLFYEEKLSVKNHQSKVGEFLISRSVEKIMNLLKLDYSRFMEGFKTQDELFAFVVKCPYLSTIEFANPTKEHKHSIYEKFQVYLIKNGLDNIKGLKLTFEIVNEFFPEVNFFDEVEKLKEMERRKKEITTKFNGREILDYFKGFDPKKIGISMTYFKLSFGNSEEYKEFVIMHSKEEVLNKFQEVVKF